MFRLLDARANVNAEDKKGRTPLHIAVDPNTTKHEWRNQFAQQRMIEELIYAGAKVNAKDKKGRTPLHIAVEECGDSINDGVDTVVRILINKGEADINPKDTIGRTPLYIAATSKGDRYDIAKEIVRGAEDYKYQEIILEEMFGQQYRGRTLIQAAKEQNNVKIAAYLEGENECYDVDERSMRDMEYTEDDTIYPDDCEYIRSIVYSPRTHRKRK